MKIRDREDVKARIVRPLFALNYDGENYLVNN